MALSHADVVKNKCLSYQKRTPKDKSLKPCTRDSASISWVTDSKEDRYTSVYSDFTPTWASSCFIQINHLLP